MDKSSAAVTKVCSSCGKQKPIAAFLQLSGPEGTSYSAICADCRKAQADKGAIPKEIDERSKTDTGFRIDAKAKVSGEKDKRKLRENVDEDYYEEREESEKTESKQIQNVQIKTKDEKKHRDFLKSRSFLSPEKKSPPIQGIERQKFDLEQRATSDHAEKQIESAKSEQEQKEIRLDAPFEDTRIAGKVKYTSGEAFKSFRTWVGSNSPLGRTLAESINKAEQIAKTAEKAGKDPLTEHIENNFSPSSRRKS